MGSVERDVCEDVKGGQGIDVEGRDGGRERRGKEERKGRSGREGGRKLID